MQVLSSVHGFPSSQAIPAPIADQLVWLSVTEQVMQVFPGALVLAS